MKTTVKSTRFCWTANNSLVLRIRPWDLILFSSH